MKAIQMFPSAAFVAALLLITGCGKVRYPTNYILNLPQAVPHVANPHPALGGAVHVHQFRCPDYLCQGAIVYRPKPEEVGFYQYHRWAMDPRDSITTCVTEALRNQGLFSVVATGERRAEPAYSLSGSINALEEVDQGGSVRVVCTLTAQLTETQSGSVLWSDTASEIRTVDERTVAGVVNSMSLAAQATVDQLMTSMAKQLGSTRERALALN